MAKSRRSPVSKRLLRKNDFGAVDLRQTAIFRELRTYRMEDPRMITACTHLLSCAKKLERIGDHVANFCEDMYCVVTGEQRPADRPENDESLVPVTLPET